MNSVSGDGEDDKRGVGRVGICASCLSEEECLRML